MLAKGLAASLFCIGFGWTNAPVPSGRPLVSSEVIATGKSRLHTNRHGRIVGVFDSMTLSPVEGAEIMDLFVNAVARTPASGLVELSGFQSRHDSTAIRVRKVGYRDTALVVMVGVMDTTPLPIFLKRAPVQLDAVLSKATGSELNSSGRLREMSDLLNDQSMKSTPLPSEALRKRDGQRMIDVLPELGIGNTLRCKPARIRVYIDDLASNDLGIPDNLSTQQYEAGVYFSIANAPARFTASARGECGVLLLWSRMSNGR